MSGNRRVALLTLLVTYVCCATVIAPRQACAKKVKKRVRIPIVMEAATLRGKVVVLESRKTDRDVVRGLKVKMWPWNDDIEETETPPLHETQTDEFGMFNLPELAVRDYLLAVGEMHLRLKVMPQAESRRGQSEPKILLILLPKEVVR